MSGISTANEINIIFSSYRQPSVSLGFPAAGELGDSLNREAQKARNSGSDTFLADRPLVRLFASAAIEMWQRALHSFIVSAALSETSPIWSSVSGYYASHYVVRGYAHLLGRYVLYRHKRIASLYIDKGKFYCLLDSKGGSEREHKTYWKFVRTSTPFGTDPFFAVNSDAIPLSDAAHRTKANYFDHIGDFSPFKELPAAAIVNRIERVGNVLITAVPIPDADEYPDLESVQIIAYHRIVRFRKFLDNLLGQGCRFWNVHRSPQWCSSFVDFQVTEPNFLAELPQ